MSLSVKLDEAAYRNALNRFVVELKADARQLLKEEMRLLLRDVIAKTPPTKSPRADAVRYNARQRGRTAIENDMRRLAKPLDPNAIRMPRLAEAVRKKDSEAISAITKNLGGDWGRRRLLGDLTSIQSAHLSARNAYGRVLRDQGNMAYLRDWSRYLRTVLSRVGWTRAGWHRPAQILGLPLPAWVTRHKAYAPSGYIAPRPSEMAITSINGSVKIPNYFERHVLPAVKTRAVSIQSELARLLRGGKSRRASLAGTPTGQA